MWPLNDKVVVLTGASRGIGAELAKRFSALGARLVLAARSKDELEQVRESLGGEALVVPTDVSNIDSLRELVAAATERLGPIDVLVNNAGIEKIWDFEDFDLDEIDRILDVNLRGTIHLSRLVAPQMVGRRQGHIINIASMAGLMPVPHNTIYSTTKHGMVGFSRSLRLELADHNVSVSVVCPGFVQGGMFLVVGKKPPAMAGWVSVEKVVAAVERTLRKDLPEVNVNKGLGKIGDWFMAISPSLTGRMLNLTGVVPFYRQIAARDRAEEKKAGTT